MIEFQDNSIIEDDDVVPAESEELYVVIIGDLCNGHRTVGPFANFDDAHAWNEEYIGTKERTWIMPLCHPNSRDAHVP